MDHLFDEFSKSLAESVPRRESLRRLGVMFAGAVLGPLGLGTAWARGPDPCKTFCQCRNKAQQTKCLAACKACNGNTSRLGGSCGTYVCCSVASCSGVCSDLRHDPNCGACGNNCGALGETCCGNYCADLANDVYNCGACGSVCTAPLPGEVVDCVSGTCVYDCAQGAVDCNGTCTFVDDDPDNCGACGNVCPPQAPNCSGGICSESTCRRYCPELWCGGDGCGGECACPNGFACDSSYSNYCYEENPCTPDNPYYPNC